MNPAEVIARLESKGVSLTLTHSGGLDVSGDKEAVMRVLPFLRDHKAAIVNLLAMNNPAMQEVEADRLIAGMTTDAPGFDWCQDHLGDLLAAGWTDTELFKKTSPLGLAWVDIWSRAGVRVSMTGGFVVFDIPQPDGSTAQQVARPDNKCNQLRCIDDRKN